MPGETKVSCAEKSETASRAGTEEAGTENAAVAPPRGALLWAEYAARWDARWGREDDQEGEEEQGGVCRALLSKEAR